MGKRETILTVAVAIFGLGVAIIGAVIKDVFPAYPMRIAGVGGIFLLVGIFVFYRGCRIKVAEARPSSLAAGEEKVAQASIRIGSANDAKFEDIRSSSAAPLLDIDTADRTQFRKIEHSPKPKPKPNGSGPKK